MRKILIQLFVMGAFVTLAFPDVFITELADPNNNAGARFVELYNNGAEVDLSTGWMLQRYTNGNVDPQSPVALTGVIGAGGYYVISPNGGAFLTAYGVDADQDIGGLFAGNTVLGKPTPISPCRGAFPKYISSAPVAYTRAY